MVKNAIQWNNKTVGIGAGVECWWVLCHEGDEGNAKGNEQAKAATE
jgi:hypothetical protein